MRLNELIEVNLHRTVRVAEGRSPSNLPPSLGRAVAYHVSEFSERCPKSWEADGVFVALHDTEALWLSFHTKKPVALLVGAGGVNALTGEKLGTTLAKDNYLVAPPQPWLDGWKDTDGTVYQFVATPYQEGKGISVAEQLIGEESKTGAIGIAVFDSKKTLTSKIMPHEGWTTTADSNDFTWSDGSVKTSGGIMGLCSASPGGQHTNSTRGMRFSEMGVGRGGKIIQKIYPDPHGLDVWNDKPVSTTAIYLVNAKVFEEITGQKIPAPTDASGYSGKWFGMNDSQEGDVAGTGKFTGLKSAVFPASTMSEAAK